MPFKVSHDTWLKTEADRIEPILLMPRYWRRAWSPESLKAELENTQHLFYSMPEIQEINDELHRRDVVTDLGP